MPETPSRPPRHRPVSSAADTSSGHSVAADHPIHRFRVIGRLLEKPNGVAERTAVRARAVVAGEWARLPTARPEPAEREPSVKTTLDSGPRLRGIIDRVAVAPTGEVRIVACRTGRAPRPEHAADALFGRSSAPWCCGGPWSASRRPCGT